MTETMEKTTKKTVTKTGDPRLDQNLFVSSSPTKEEIIANAAESEKRLLPLRDEIAGFQKRLASSVSKLNNAKEAEETIKKDVQQALALGQDASAKTESLKAIRNEIEMAQNEQAGLQDLIDSKNAELKTVTEEIARKEFFLSRVDLFKVYDQYNKDAAVLTDTLKKMFDAVYECAILARACGYGEHETGGYRHITRILEEIPRLVARDDNKTEGSDRWWWNAKGFAIDRASGRS
jgi:ATP-dependent Lon protease